MEKLSTISVKGFMLNEGFVSVVKFVRENENHYPYITFMDQENQATNIYFSKNAARMVAKGEVIGKGWLNQFEAALTHNAQGEPRWKLVAKGLGLRLDIDDLF